MSNESKPAPSTTVYRAQVLGFERGGANVHCSIGTVTPCGDWVEVGAVRHPLNVSWYVRRCDAEASIVRDIERAASALMAQAEELRRRAEV